jgi:hypothetical protein
MGGLASGGVGGEWVLVDDCRWGVSTILVGGWDVDMIGEANSRSGFWRGCTLGRLVTDC